MSTLTSVLLILLLIDSVALVVFTYRQSWKMFFICLASGGVLDLLLVKYGSFASGAPTY